MKVKAKVKSKKTKRVADLGDILNDFGIEKIGIAIQPVQQGLINHTWKVAGGDRSYILQKINDKVFTRPDDIAFNIECIDSFLKKNRPGYLFVSPIKDLKGNSLLHKADGYYRLFPFIEGSHTINVVQTAQQAYEAAKQFGKLTAMLEGFDASALKITIPSFHDLSFRYRQFETALQNGNPERILEAKELAEFLQSQSRIVNKYESIKKDPAFRLRVMHHDSKISNVLFDANENGLCVIDLDTLMPGYFISDVGDMMRTYLSPVNEEEADLSKIVVRKEYYEAIEAGYLSEMQTILTPAEKEHFLFAGEFMIYMQALRFLTDYLNNDIYYGSSYPKQNLMRAGTQIVLLQSLHSI